MIQKNCVLIGIMIVFVSCCTLKGQVIVHAQDEIQQLVQKHIAANKTCGGKMIGFCIQICSESGNRSRERAEAVRSKFLSKYPKISAFVSFNEPNFRVRVGAFRTRSEARGFLNEIKADFPQSFVVKDEVRYPTNAIRKEK